MVMLSIWWRTAPDNGILSDLPMSGEGTGIGVSTLAPAGYLGKVQDSSAVDRNCPWCAAKGQINALRSYAINFTEFITLCTSPKCLFPLVSRSVEDICASLTSRPDLEGRKRKISLSCEVETPSKQQKGEALVCDDDSAKSHAAPAQAGQLSIGNQEPRATEKACLRSDEESNGLEGDSGLLDASQEVLDVSQGELDASQEVLDLSQGEFYASQEVLDASQGELDASQEVLDASQGEPEVMPAYEMAINEMPTEELVAVPPHLFWKNENSLCWLDTLLVALVHCKTLRESAPPHNEVWTLREMKPNLHIGMSLVWNVCARYDKACTSVKTKEQVCEDNVVRVPSEVLQEAERELSELRLSIFTLLQPKLQCKLGHKETPVFALPLLLRMDDWAQDLFQHSIQWDFQCAICGHTFNNSCEKTITTFTQVVSDWHPLNAVHKTQCSHCHRKNQTRKMVLERVPPVFVLHFVEGLPHNDVTKYSFDFQGRHYAVNTVIQYNHQLKHFVTWIHKSDGSWLEFDDLKYPSCTGHKKLTIPAKQIHLVFWEVAARKDHTTTGPNSQKDLQHNQSLSMPQDDTFVIEALTLNEDKDTAAVSPMDASIGSTTLLDTFEGLSHNDIVTLTLVEVKVDAEGRPMDCPREPVASPSVAEEPEILPVPEEDTENVAPSPPKLRRGRSKAKVAKIAAEQVEPEIILPSVVLPPPAETSVSTTVIPAVSATEARLSFLLSRHPSLQSTPLPQRQAPPAPLPRCDLRREDNEALPAKPAELFGGFKARQLSEPSKTTNLPCQRGSQGMQGGGVKQPFVKPAVPQPAVISSQKPVHYPGATTTIPLGATELPKIISKKHPSRTSTPQALSDTDALRLKLMKKLKAKRKRLEELNKLLGQGGESVPKPDRSPYAVSSSTSIYDSPADDQFFADLLSPATTASNLSPDSTGLLEMLASTPSADLMVGTPQEKPVSLQPGTVSSMAPQPLLSGPSSTNEDFFDEFISGSGMPQAVIESTDFLDMLLL